MDFGDTIEDDDSGVQWMTLQCRSFTVGELLIDISQDAFLKNAIQLSEPSENSCLHNRRTQVESNERPMCLL